MKIKDFLNYLNEGVREDEFSHLNDGLHANNEGRDDYDFEDDSTKDYGDYDDWYDDDDDRGKLTSSNPKFNKYDDDDDYEEEDDDQSDDLDHLLYLLRQMFRNAGVSDVRVTAARNSEILIECHLGLRDRLRNVIKIFEVANKLKRDILAQYDSEFDMWSSGRGGGTIFTFGFELNEGLEDDSMPF